MGAKQSDNHATYAASLGLTTAQAAVLSNTDMERRVHGVALGLSGIPLVSKSINDLRKLRSLQVRDYS